MGFRRRGKSRKSQNFEDKTRPGRECWPPGQAPTKVAVGLEKAQDAHGSSPGSPMGPSGKPNPHQKSTSVDGKLKIGRNEILLLCFGFGHGGSALKVAPEPLGHLPGHKTAPQIFYKIFNNRSTSQNKTYTAIIH